MAAPVTSSKINVQSVVGIELAPNSVKSLHLYPFERRTLAEKLVVKELGPDKPDVNITQQAREKEKTYKRTFSRGWFDRKAWLTSCGYANAIFCFPCLLFKTSVLLKQVRCSFSYSLSITHTRSFSYSLTHTWSFSYSLSLSHTLTLSYSFSHSLTHTHTLAVILLRSHSHTNTLAVILLLWHTHTRYLNSISFIVCLCHSLSHSLTHKHCFTHIWY
jgi:hypothetical protein